MDDKKTSNGNGFSDPSSVDDMVGMYLSAVKGVLSSLNDYETKDGETKGGAVGSDVMYLLAQAQAKWLTSALRYWQQVATIISTQGTDAVDAIKPETNGDGMSDEARRLFILDKARAALREISDLSIAEAKLLQRDLMEVEAELRDVVADDGTDRDGPHRYAKAKQ